MSTTSRDVVTRRKAGTRRPLRPITWVILGIILAAIVATMALVLTGIWPLGGGGSEPPAGSVKPTSPFAAGIAVEKVGEPVRAGGLLTETVQISVTLVITNGVKQPPAAHGTPTPGAPTPGPEPAKVYNATVKVLFYDKKSSDRKIVGSAVGNYFNKDGLEPGKSATIEAVGFVTGKSDDYEIFPDTVWTDKDPVKTPEPGTP